MTETGNNTTIHRYPGVKPFSVAENFLFFGRETDLEALSSLIFIKQSVVLYGKSGYGKSSLINAGIIPNLQKTESWVYFYIRFNNFSEKEAEQNLSPSQTIKQRFAEKIKKQEDNILDNLIPNEDSFWYWIKQNQFQKRKVNFIIFFDQFEELFTYPKEQVNEFSEQLSQLLYTTIPVNFKKKIAGLEPASQLSDDLHDFLFEKPEIKAIFSIRSDRLSLLNTLTDKHPSILQNCYELDALNIEDAKKAIIEPAKLPKELGFNTPPFSFTDTAITKILNSIANPQDGKIEAATLQIVCRYVEDSMVRENHYSEIDETKLGDITDIFQQYYQSILHKLTDKERIQAQRLIEDELIDENKRNPLSAAYIKSKFGLSDKLLNQLEQSSLLRKERDAAGRILYEVSHDSLITAIEKVAAKRRKEDEDIKKSELEKQIIEERKRAEVLEELNKKAVFRFKLALGLVALSLLIAIIAVYFRNESVKAVKMANRQTEIANQKALESQIALFNNKILEAKSFLVTAEGFMNTEEYGLALQELSKAKNSMKSDFQLPPREEEEKQKILTQIREKENNCTEKLNIKK